MTGLLLAALDDVSEHRLAAYQAVLAGAGTLRELVNPAERVLAGDLEAGHVAVLTELLVAATSVPGLDVEVETRLAPWRGLAQGAVARAFELVPLAGVVPVDEAAHVVVATLLGLELLAGAGDECVTGTEEWSPCPRLVVGVVLVVAGVVLTAVAARHRAPHPAPAG